MFKYNEIGKLEIIDKTGLDKHLNFKYKTNEKENVYILNNLINKNKIKYKIS